MISLRDLTDIPVVLVKPLHHRQQKVTAIFFNKDYILIKAVKKLAGIRFSNSQKCWYVSPRPGLTEEIRECFDGIAEVNVKDIETPLPIVAGNRHTDTRVTRKNCPEAYTTTLIQNRYSETTIKNYCAQFEMFIAYYEHRNVADLTDEDIRAYMQRLLPGKRFLFQHKMSPSMPSSSIMKR